jgi:hypothetical protein
MIAARGVVQRRAVVVAYLLAQLADIVTTYLALSTGRFREGGYLAVLPTGSMYAVKAVVAVAVLWVAVRRPHAERLVVGLTVITVAAGPLHNVLAMAGRV